VKYEIKTGHVQDKDPRAKFINVPIHCYDEMEFIFQDKHATGEFTVLQAPYDLPSTQNGDLIGDKNANHGEDVHLGLQYDSECLVEEDGNNGGSSSSKRPAASKPEKVKRTKRDDSAISEVTHVLRDMSDTMRFTHVTHPNEELFKTIDAMKEYPLFVRLELQEYLANNEKTAAMLKGRPLEAIKEYVERWFVKNYPPPMI